MAGSLASLIRGQDVVEDAQALKDIAAEQLDINPHAFHDVVGREAEIIKTIATPQGEIGSGAVIGVHDDGA